MSDVAENVLLEKFSSSGRTGRRNALPDVMDKKYVGTSVASLPGQLDQLCLQMPSSEKLEKPTNTKDDKPSSPGASAKTEQDKATKANVS
ncbi:hypothetical protein NP493_69g01008 [Ridgeia piscesae]|uniref:cAMP-dependent protein kinase inhibitor beta n=1 Tax=Ridgeia piscesae TaxID=27915 RepID=A0AAD9UIN9_RIDPI|nr:hypothetical protein NP493_69g01008 [Ridgeia piscesae]